MLHSFRTVRILLVVYVDASSSILSLFAAQVALAFLWFCMKYTAKIVVDPEKLIGYLHPQVGDKHVYAEKASEMAGYTCKLIDGNGYIFVLQTYRWERLYFCSLKFQLNATVLSSLLLILCMSCFCLNIGNQE